MKLTRFAIICITTIAVSAFSATKDVIQQLFNSTLEQKVNIQEEEKSFLKEHIKYYSSSGAYAILPAEDMVLAFGVLYYENKRDAEYADLFSSMLVSKSIFSMRIHFDDSLKVLKSLSIDEEIKIRFYNDPHLIFAADVFPNTQVVKGTIEKGIYIVYSLPKNNIHPNVSKMKTQWLEHIVKTILRDFNSMRAKGRIKDCLKIITSFKSLSISVPDELCFDYYTSLYDGNIAVASVLANEIAETYTQKLLPDKLREELIREAKNFERNDDIVIFKSINRVNNQQ